MIRIPTDEGWLLIRHQDHARFAGDIARRWGNARFTVPGPLKPVILAVSHHDDAWVGRDAEPEIAPDGAPAAFSQALVGAYSAFENIDLEAYLRVRGLATESIAAEQPLAAALISMHTVNLLTEQADLSGLNADQLALHAEFIHGQQARQLELHKRAVEETLDPHADAWDLQRGFMFLQACDSCSLITCVDYPEPIPLRHRHQTLDGEWVTIMCHPLGERCYRLDPYPLDAPVVTFSVPAKRIQGKTFPDSDALRQAYAGAESTNLQITIQQ